MDKEKFKKMIEENSDIIYDNVFFDSLKSSSLLEFRKNINMIQDISPSLYTEEKVDKYYDELLNEYDNNSKMFKIYNKILDGFKNKDYSFLDSYKDFNYFIDEEMITKLQDYCHYGDRVELAYDYLTKATSQKISEIVVDGLFKDTIYNVWLNMKEVIRYHNGLDDKDKIFSEEKLKFYKEIIWIDQMKNTDKINMYKKLKDKNVALMFYEDWNLLKRHSYNKIKNCLFKIEAKKELLNNEESNKYKIPVYELNGDDFYMMISCRNAYTDIDSIMRHCYSLISSYNMEVFSKRKFIYGYTDFDSTRIFHVFEKDINSSSNFDSNSFTTYYVNRIMEPKQISDSYGYSEIQMLNKKKSDMDNTYEVIKPSYLVVFDKILDKYVKEAERLGIPIVKINTSKYLDKIKEGFNNRFNLGFDRFENVFDIYTNGGNLEDMKKLRR